MTHLTLNDLTTVSHSKGREAATALIEAGGFIFSEITSADRSAARSLFNAAGLPSVYTTQLSMADFKRVFENPENLSSVLLSCEGVEAIDTNVTAHLLNAFGTFCAEAGASLMASRFHDASQNRDSQDKTTPKPDTQPQPQPQPQPQNGLAGAIAAAIEGALAASGAGQIDEEQMRSIVRQEVRKLSVPQTITIKGPEPREVTGLQHKDFERLLKAVTTRSLVNGRPLNICLVGPAGSGKTTAAAKVADALGLPFEFTGALTSEYKLSGFIDAQGRIVSTAFRRAYENGGVFLFDEIDASTPSAVIAFNAALANDHADFPDGKIKRHDNFYCIAGANTFGSGADREYVGRYQLDGASRDRFVMMDWDYDEKLENTLCSNNEWRELVQSYRQAVAKLKVRHIVSPRASFDGETLLAAGWTIAQTEAATIWKGLDASTVRKIKNEAQG